MPGSNWHPGDFDFWASKKAMNKVQRNLDALPYDFNLTVLVGNFGDVRQLVPEQPVYDDKINVVYCNNVSTKENWIPMTSWILLHRIAHCMATQSPVFNDDYTVVNGPEFNLFAGLDELWALAYSPNHYQRRTESFITAGGYSGSRKIPGVLTMRESKSNDKSWNCLGATQDAPAAGFLATYLFTMRSARERALSNELDIFAEAFAQFLHTGRFRLKRWQDSGIEELVHTHQVPKGPRSQTDWACYLRQDLTHRLTSVEALDEKITEIETDINTRMAELAKRMVGHQFSF